MRRFFLNTLGFVLALSLTTPAYAVLLDSSGSNDEYIGVANFAFSYAASPLELTGSCQLYGADDSFWEAPSTCSSNGEACWATTCDDCNGAAAYVQVGSMRKALLHYYARDHKDDGQGQCFFTAGTSSFSVSFDYQDTGVDFSLSLSPGGGPDWTSEDGDLCPYESSATSGPLLQRFYANTDVNSAYNLICNEDVIVSLSADPDVSNGAMLVVTNNPYGLQSGVQEVSDSSSATRRPGTRAGQSTSSGRRLADRATEEGRWLVAGDGSGNSFQGILISEDEKDPTVEFVACETGSTPKASQAGSGDQAYSCTFVSQDGTSTRTQSLSLPDHQLRPRSLAGPVPGPRNGAPAPGTALGILKSIEAIAPLGHVASSIQPEPSGETRSSESTSEEGSRPVVWQGGDSKRQIMMVQDRSIEALEVVSHVEGALSPGFMSCTERDEDPRNLEYLCRAANRCLGAPCSAGEWNAGQVMEFPKALFKDRPCRPGEGGEVQKARLTLNGLGKKGDRARLRFRSTVAFEEGADVSPQSDGFRLLIEDALGKTVVDVDLPPAETLKASGRRAGQAQGWKVRRKGDLLQYSTADDNGGVVPRVKIQKRGKASNVWAIDVKGRKGLFGQDELTLPLSASLSLDSKDPNSDVCAVVPFMEEDDEEQPLKGGPIPLTHPLCKRKSKGKTIQCVQK